MKLYQTTILDLIREHAILASVIRSRYYHRFRCYTPTITYTTWRLSRH